MVDEVHKPSTWVTVQIRIIKYESSKCAAFYLILFTSQILSVVLKYPWPNAPKWHHFPIYIITVVEHHILSFPLRCNLSRCWISISHRGDESAGKRSHRNRSSSPERVRLLQPLLPHPPKRGWPVTYSRFQIPESRPDEKVVQDDHFETDPRANMPRGLVHVAGSERRILSYPGSPPSQTILEIRIRKGGISIQGPTIWSVPGSPHFYARHGCGTLPFSTDGKIYAETIAAFHASIAGWLVGRDSAVIQFLRGARRMNPPHPRTVPSWDLPTVLRALKGSPF